MDDARTRRWMTDVIERSRAVLQARIAERLATADYGAYARRSPEEVAGWVGDALTAILASLCDDGVDTSVRHASRLTRDRLSLGFPIQDVVQASVFFHEIVATLLLEDREPGAPPASEAVAVLLGIMRRFLTGFTREFSTALQTSVEAERARTVLMLGAVEAVGASLDLQVVLERVAHGIATALGVPWCGIFFPGDDPDLFAPRAMSGALGADHMGRLLGRVFDRRRDEVIGEPFAKREPVVFRGSRGRCLLCGGGCASGGIGAAVGFPIVRGDRHLAVALAASFDEGHEFGAEPIKVAWGLANIVAPAVDNARLHEETTRQLSESRSLQRVMRAAIDSQDLVAVLTVVCQEARGFLEARGCAIVLDDGGESDCEPSIVTCRGTACEEREGVLALAAQLSRTATPRAGVISLEGARLPLAGGREFTAARIIAVPLRHGGASVGLLLVVDPTLAFGRSAERVANLFADHATVAIGNERLRRHRERIAVLEERERLAHDLHDSVSQALYGVTMYAEAAVRLVRGDRVELAESYLRELRDTSLDALRQMRLLIFELRPPDLRERGLVAALEARLLAVEARSGVVTDFDADLSERIPLRVEDALLGIAQEALNNALKHARPKTIRVRVRREGDTVRLDIVDDGIGFDPDVGRRRGGLGLRGMAERAGKIRATLAIDSRPGEGTSVSVVVSATLSAKDAIPRLQPADTRPAEEVDP